jgi:Pyridoxamine 5'-phosphate oxidase
MDSEMSSSPVPWEHVERSLRNSSSYWLCTTRADGRPHAMPVWGVWHDGALWFGTGPRSIKGRNLARDPRCVVHLESGDDVVILEGRVEQPDTPAQVIAAYDEKYVMRLEVSGLYRFAPETAQAWIEALYLDSAVKFRFGEDGAPVAVGRPMMATA